MILPHDQIYSMATCIILICSLTYTQETLKTYKSLHTAIFTTAMLSYELDRYACLKSKVNPSQKEPDQGDEARVCLCDISTL